MFICCVYVPAKLDHIFYIIKDYHLLFICFTILFFLAFSIGGGLIASLEADKTYKLNYNVKKIIVDSSKIC